MENQEENISNSTAQLEKKGDFLFRFSVWLFIVILISTASLYLYKLGLESSLNNTNSEISNIDKSISDLKTDKSLQVYNLYNLNKTVIDNEFKKSNVNVYINYLGLTASKYGLKFDGFNYDTKKISTTLTSTTDTNLWYLKLIKFIGDYRTTTNNLVDLEFVNSINGSDKISTALVFDVK